MQIRLSLRDKIKREGEEALSKYIVKRVFLAVAGSSTLAALKI